MANCWSTRYPLKQVVATVMLVSGVALTAKAFANDRDGEPRLRDRFADLAISDELPVGLTLGAFERSLQTRYFGTYVFYESLSEQDREGVYETYLRDSHIAAIRTATLERLK